jgi:hypothetical protein
MTPELPFYLRYQDAESSQDTTQEASFRCFPDLPPEMRHEIWRHAASSGEDSKGICILSLKKDSPDQYEPLVVYLPRPSSLSATNKEAREISSKCPPPTRAYDPATDILYVSRAAFFDFTSKVCKSVACPWVSKIKHLALCVSVSKGRLWLPRALEHMGSLETISVVYPRTSGRIESFEEVALPSDRSVSLRLLTDEEKAGLTIVTDHVYDPWGGGVYVGDDNTVGQHLLKIESELVRSCSPRTGVVAVPSLWDYGTMTLKLRYDARVFESSPYTDQSQVERH